MDKRKQQFLDAMHFRHACKIFDTDKKIPDNDFNFILETGRLSPTSFGMEGVRLYLITDEILKKKLKPVCWNQNQIDTCSHLVVFTTLTQDLEPYSQWVKERFASRNLPKEAQKKYLDVYAQFHKTKKCPDIYEWGTRQAYIFLGNMLTAAAMLQIDSCPIEGFVKEDVETILNLDTTQEEVALIAAFGYRVDEVPQKKRLPLKSICKTIKG